MCGVIPVERGTILHFKGIDQILGWRVSAIPSFKPDRQVSGFKIIAIAISPFKNKFFGGQHIIPVTEQIHIRHQAIPISQICF